MMTITVEPKLFSHRFERADRRLVTERTLKAVRRWAVKKVRSFSPGIAHTLPRIDVDRDPSRRVTLVGVDVGYSPLPEDAGIVVVPDTSPRIRET